MNARQVILDRIRAALGEDAHARPAVPRSYRTAGTLTTTALIALLTERLEDYRASVHRCSPDEVSATVRRVLDDRGVRRLVVPPVATADLTGWAGEQVVDEPTRPVPVAELDVVDGVLTACSVAVAETGTIILDAGPDQGRRVISLVPDYHLVVVRAEQIVQTVPEAVHRLDPSRPLTWISGPSATSDIELSRVEGVHGPRTLDVVLVEPA